jgi:integrase
MGRPAGRLPKYVHGYIDRHGRPRHYLRRPGRKKVPLPGLPHSTEFMDAYESALKDANPVVIGINRSTPGTVAEAVARYLGSVAFADLAPTTQAMRRATLERFRSEHGQRPIRKMQAEHAARLLGRLRPHAQRNMLKAMRALIAFAMSEGLVDIDPTATVKLKPAKDSGGFPTWPVECIEQYRAHHKLGTIARLALELLYGTMQRRGDVVKLGRQHIKGGILSLRQQKTGIQVDIPVLPELAAAIDAVPQGQLTFLTDESGKPLSPSAFSYWFAERCRESGVPSNLSAHGLRKAGATRLADNGCTDHEIMAWGGWTTLKEVQRYTRAADRKRLAMQAAGKLKRRTELG